MISANSQIVSSVFPLLHEFHGMLPLAKSSVYGNCPFVWRLGVFSDFSCACFLGFMESRVCNVLCCYAFHGDFFN